jgi:hypothetical protein
MAEQIQSLSGLLPESSPFGRKFMEADVLISDLENTGYNKQAQDYRNKIISQVELGKRAKNPKEVRAIAGNIEGMLGGLKSLSKTTLEKKPQPDEPYTYITPEQEVQQYGGPLEGTYVRKGAGGKPERIEPGRTYASPQESFRLEQLKAADQSLTDVKKEAESFLKVTPELNQLSRLLDAGIQTGKFENLVLPLRQFAEDVGLPVGDVANQEQFRALSGQLALTFGQQLKGSMSDGDRALLVDRISPSVATSPEGNKMIIAFYKAGAEKNKKIRNAILQGRKKGLDPYEIEEKVNEIVDSDFIADQVKTQFPQLQEQGQQAAQPPAINYTPDAQNALEKAKAFREAARLKQQQIEIQSQQQKK